jgi:hypothetical protein
VGRRPPAVPPAGLGCHTDDGHDTRRACGGNVADVRYLLPITAGGLVAGAALLIVVFSSRGIEDRYTGPDDAAPVAVSVADVVDVAERWFREPVVVEGDVLPVDSERFVLDGPRARILVRPEPGVQLPRQRAGVRVTGVVTRLGRLQAAELEAMPGGVRASVRGAPAGVGAPYIRAEEIRRATVLP